MATLTIPDDTTDLHAALIAALDLLAERRMDLEFAAVRAEIEADKEAADLADAYDLLHALLRQLPDPRRR